MPDVKIEALFDLEESTNIFDDAENLLAVVLDMFESERDTSPWAKKYQSVVVSAMNEVRKGKQKVNDSFNFLFDDYKQTKEKASASVGAPTEAQDKTISITA